jgi:predicted secreted protein
MTLVTILAVYLVVWWLALFVVLPFGVRTQDDDADTVLGTPSSAPSRPMLVRKAIATSILAAVIVGLLWVLSARFGLSIDSLARMFGVPST